MYDLDRAQSFLRAVWHLSRSTAGGLAGTTFICSKAHDGSWAHCSVTGGFSDSSLQFLYCEAQGGSDLYFTPNRFEPAQRSPTNALPGRFLYADLDEVGPWDCPIVPSLSWESSPGRYQALWLLNCPLPPAALAAIGRALVYAVGADKDSWALNKVLRIPGTENHKYPAKPQVTLLDSHEREIHDVEALLAALRRIRAAQHRLPLSTPQNGSAPPLSPPDATNLPTAAAIMRSYRDALPRRARKLLTVRSVAGEDRSARLWELENLCLDAGMAPKDVFVVIRDCAYNKFSGRADETARLWADINRAVEYRSQK